MGVDRASLYYYIASKEELFQEAITALVLGNIDKAAVISAEALGPREKLEKLVALVINSHVEHYPYMYVYIQEDMRRVGDQDAAWAVEMVAATHRLERYFMDAIDEGVAIGEFRSGQSTTLVANALFGMMLWTHRWYHPGSRYSAQELIDTFTSLFFSGIQTLPTLE
jgi:TetR/AcrR family transcriptional regulator, cholesterol catabolism regulator